MGLCVKVIKLMGLRLLTAGESHGEGLTVILEGFPRGVKLSEETLAKDLERRRLGFGRSPRMKLEADSFKCVSGLRGSYTTGAPIAFSIRNAEADKWAEILDPWIGDTRKVVSVPRPGHADMPGAIKYASVSGERLQPADIRDISERASARETAGRVIAGSICLAFLKELGAEVFSFVFQIGKAKLKSSRLRELLSLTHADFLAIQSVDSNTLRIPDEEVYLKAKAEISRAQKLGTTLGGGFAVLAFNVPQGLGSFSQWDRRLDGRLSQALISIPAVKGVGIGQILWRLADDGRSYQDEIIRGKEALKLKTNNDGGINGGITNGMPIVLTALMKPLPTQARPLASVDLRTGSSAKAFVERHDITSVPAGSIIGEAMVSFILASEILEVFGGDELSVIKERVATARRRMSAFFETKSGRQV